MATHAKQHADPDELLTLGQAAEIVKMHRATLWTAAKKGTLAHEMVGGNAMTSRRALDAYMQTRPAAQKELAKARLRKRLSKRTTQRTAKAG